MEKKNFNYSLKNIPVPSVTTYKMKLIEKVESVIKRMRWKAIFFTKENKELTVENYGFKSKKCPPHIKELENFEDELLDMVRTVKFNNYRDNFQSQLRADIANINTSQNVLIPADKTNNLYDMKPETHNKLLNENITKSYKKAPERIVQAINSEAKCTAEKLKIDDRVEHIARRQAFITLKDHKENFNIKPTCRLLNPTKSELGKISKNILTNINSTLKRITNFNQWRSSADVIEWFKTIDDKTSRTFTQFDIKDFYPSITENTLECALTYAKEHLSISDNDLRIIRHCRKSLLFHEDTPWIKKGNGSLFDVTMGSYDGAEVCDLIGLYLISILKDLINQADIGLYRDDGLLTLKNLSGPQRDKLRKNIIKIFSNVGFNIEIQTGLKTVNFLDITFDLSNGTFKPFKKPNDPLLYINVKSNHPPQIIKQLPTSIAQRLSDNSANEQIFEECKPEYEEALRTSGYSSNESELKFIPRKPPRKNRKRQVIWFNPPFNKNVATNIGKTFLGIIDKHFPPKNKLHKIFNRNTVKISYSCTENMAQIIKKHNKSITQTKGNTNNTCNCRNKAECPLDGNCLAASLVYKGDVDDKAYIGATEGPFKPRCSVHKTSFNIRRYANTTSLAQHIWSKKDSTNVTPNVKWSIIKHAPAYSNISKKCELCLREKLAIITYPELDNLLNKKSELISKCRHENKFLLRNYKTR